MRLIHALHCKKSASAMPLIQKAAAQALIHRQLD